MDEDLFLALAILDAQLVVATAARAAEALEDAAGLVRRQLVGHRVGGVVDAAADQRLVGIAFEEVHQHFHADPRNDDAAIAVAGPTAGYAQPATALVVALALAVPVELHPDPAVAVAVDFLARRAGHHRGLAAQHARLRVLQRRAEEHLPGRGEEAVAVALLEVVRAGRRVGGNVLFQHLRLLAFVEDFAEQPQVVPLRARVLGDLQEVPADQQRLVADPFAQAPVGAVPLQGALVEQLAALAIDEATGVVVVLQVRLGRGVGSGAIAGLQQQPRLLEVVVAASGARGAAGQAQAEALDHRFVGDQPAVVHVGGGTAQAGEHRLVVAEHQQVRLGAVPEMEMDALFGTEALDEMQVAFVVLHAVFALGIPGAELEAVGVGEDAVLLEDQGDDLRHREVLEDPLVVALGEVGQVRDEGEAIAGQALAGIALGSAVDQAVDTLALRGEGEEGGPVHERFEVEAGALADQFEFEAVGPADAFVAVEGEDLQVVTEAVEAEAEVGLVGRVEHPLSPVSRKTCTAGVPVRRARSEVRDRADATSKKLCKLLRTSPENRGAPESQYYETKYVRENPMGAD
ncbi:hypothetical protein LT18_05424 [Pseudomonas aeruginosa]|nr:hypothetical protein LT18_05424 [Pseudomonas aeruginosa]